MLFAAAHEFVPSPSWTDKLTAWATLGTAIVIAITAIAAIRTLRDSRKTRHAQILFDFSKSWDEDSVRDSAALMGSKFKGDALHDLAERAMSATPEQEDLDDFYKVEVWPNLIENLGVLENQGAIKKKVVYKNFGAGVMVAWKSWESAVYRIREINGYPETYRYFEELAGKMRVIAEKQSRGRWWAREKRPTTSSPSASVPQQASEAAADKSEESSDS